MMSQFGARTAPAWTNDPARPDPRLRPTGADQRLTTIGEIARDHGVTLRALRFYEDKGLLTPLRQGTARLYRPEDKRRLTLILTGKKLGFTLTQIRQLLETAAPAGEADGDRPEFERALSADQVSTQLAALERQREDLDAAIAQLRAAHAAMSVTSE
jgi:DNA-binding transcriptional MerR regulator